MTFDPTAVHECHRCHRLAAPCYPDHADRPCCGYCAVREGIDLIGFHEEDDAAAYALDGPH